jgi:hypothetical protein
MKISVIFSSLQISKILIIFFVLINKFFSIRNVSIGAIALNSKYNHSSSDNLYFIFEHFRHGARSTCEGKFFNNTDILNGKWQDQGELSNLGRIQHYIIGTKNKLRYKNFLNSEYDPKEIKIFSTNYNRTINSAQMQLLGLYHHISYFNISNKDIIGEDKIDSNLNSIIPPINLFEFHKESNREIFDIFYTEKFTCPLFKENIIKNYQEIYTFETLNNIRNNFNEKYFNALLTEFNLNDTKTHKGMYNFCDAFITNFFDEGINRLNLDKLEQKYKYINLTDILNICYSYYKEYFFRIEGERHAEINGRLSMSKTFKKIVNIMKDRTNNENQNYINYNSPKLLLYSGHDDTLTQMQMFLKACFNIEYEWIFELRKYGDIFYVEIYYNDRLKLNITFKKFYNEINKKIISDKEIYEKCYKYRSSYRFINNKAIYYLIILIFLFIVFISITIYFIIENQKELIVSN